MADEAGRGRLRGPAWRAYRVRVRFAPASEGGYSGPRLDGQRSLLAVGDQLTSCALWTVGGGAQFPLGQVCEADLDLLAPGRHQGALPIGFRSTLHDGRRRVGELEIVALDPSRS